MDTIKQRPLFISCWARAVSKAYWRDIIGFQTTLSGFIGYHSTSANAGLNRTLLEVSCSWPPTRGTGPISIRSQFPISKTTISRDHFFIGCGLGVVYEIRWVIVTSDIMPCTVKSSFKPVYSFLSRDQSYDSHISSEKCSFSRFNKS